MALQNVGNSIHLHLAGVFKPTLPDGSLQLILQKQLVPANQIGAELIFSFGFVRVDLFLVRTVIVVVWDVHF